MADSVAAESNADLALAVGLYALGEFTLGEAAEYADVSRQQFREVLAASSVETRIGPENADDVENEVKTALNL